MPLQFQQFNVPLGYGVKLGDGPYSMEPPGLLALVNGRVGVRGLIQKRRGYLAIASVGATPRKVMTHTGTLLCAAAGGIAESDTILYAYDHDEADWTRQGLGWMSSTMPDVEIIRRTVSRDGSKGHNNPDHCIAGNYCVTAYEVEPKDNSGNPDRIFVTVQDISSAQEADDIGDRTRQQMPVTTTERDPSPVGSSDPTTHPRCLSVSGDAILVYRDLLNNKVRAETFTTSTEIWGGNATLASDAHGATNTMDACVGASNVWFVAYRTTTPNIKVMRFSGTSTIATHTVTISEDAQAIGVYANSSNVWVYWFDSANGVRCAILSPTDLTTTLAAATVDATTTEQVDHIGATEISTNKAVLLWSRAGSNSTPSRPELELRTIDTSGTLGTQRTRQNLILCARPIGVGSYVFAVVRYDAGSVTGATDPLALKSEGFSGLFLLQIGALSNLDATAADDVFRINGWAQAGLAVTKQGRSHISNLVNTTGGAASSVLLTMASVVDFDFARSDAQAYDYAQAGTDLLTWARVDEAPYDRRWSQGQMARASLFSGSYPAVYDGQAVTEHYFAHPPEGGTMASTTGGSLSAGDYSVALVWEYRTAQGDVMLSPPALCKTSAGATSITVSANDKVTVTVPSLTVTHKYDTNSATVATQRAVRVRLYRTRVNDDIYYLDPSNAASAANNPYSTSLLSLETSASDSIIEAQETLYTTGGELDHYPFPALDHVCVHDNRWFGIPSEDPNAVVFSCEQELGEVPWHHPNYVVRIDADGPNIAIQPLDDKLLVFKADAVWVIHGRGPARNGTDSSYIAQRLASSQGCIERRSVAATEQGVFFQSRIGIHVVDRGLNVQYVGEDIERLFGSSYDPVVIMCAEVLSDSQEVYFYAKHSGTTPIVYVYNYGVGQWAYDIIAGSEGNTSIIDATYYRGTLVATSTAVTPYAHTGYADPGTKHITLGVTTSWIKLDGIAGYQRCRWVNVLAQDDSSSMTPYEWRVAVAYNYEVTDEGGEYNPSVSQTESFLWADINARASDQPFARVHLDRQKCTAIAIKISDAVDSVGAAAPAQGASIAGLTLDVGLRGRLYPTPQANMQQ